MLTQAYTGRSDVWNSVTVTARLTNTSTQHTAVSSRRN